MTKYLNKLTIHSALAVAALAVLAAAFFGSVSAGEDQSGTAAGTVVNEEPVLYDLCRTDDDGATFTFIEDVPESDLRDSDVYNGEDEYSVTGQADCDALEEETPPPPADTDGDGINHDSDECPSEAETVNGFEDADGCPDTPPENEPTATPTPTPDADACPDAAPPTVDLDGDGCEDEAAAAGEDEIVVQQTGTVQICKRFVVQDPTGLVADFEASYVDQAGPDFSLDPGECFPGFGESTTLPPGSYLVEELTNQLPPGIVFHSIGCSITSGEGQGQDSTFQEQGASVTINLADGDSVLCIFFNADENATPGTITVCKQTEPDEEPATSAFTFFTNFSASFDIGDDQCQEAEPRVPGIGYSVREDDPFADFFLLGIGCTGTDQANVTFATGFGAAEQDYDFGHDTAIIQLQEGENVTCTFTNEEGGELVGCVPAAGLAGFGGTEPCGFIQVCKNFGPPVDPSIEASFEVSWLNTVGPDLTLADEECNEDDPGKPLAPGDYLITELVDLLPPGLAFDEVNGINCSIVEGGGEGEDSTFVENGPSVTVGLAEEDSVRCFVNNALIGGGCDVSFAGFGGNGPTGCIEVCKVVGPDSDQDQPFSFQTEGAGLSIDPLSHEECDTAEGLDNGVYFITEIIPLGWSLDLIQCTQSQGSFTGFLRLGEGEQGGPFTKGDDTVRVDLADGGVVSCVFTDSERAGGPCDLPASTVAGFGVLPVCGFIQVCKDFGPGVDPNTVQSFEVDFINTAGPDFLLQDDDCLASDPGQPVAPGQHTIEEVVELSAPGIVFDRAECDTTGETTTATVNGNQVDIFLPSEGVVTCTFFNVLAGTIEVCKETIPDEEPEVTQFSIGGDPGEFLLFDDECDTSGPLAPGGGGGPNGGWELNEGAPDGWTLIDIQCEGTDPANLIFLPSGEATFQEGDTNVSPDVQGGENVTCTFFNEADEVGGGGDDDDDAADDEDDGGDQPGQRQPRPRGQQPGAGGKPGVGTGDGSFTPTEDGSRNVMLPALAFLGATGLLTLGFTHWQRRR